MSVVFGTSSQSVYVEQVAIVLVIHLYLFLSFLLPVFYYSTTCFEVVLEGVGYITDLALRECDTY